MRSRDQLELKPGEYADFKRAERQRILAELLRDLRQARARQATWYVDALGFAQRFNRRPLR